MFSEDKRLADLIDLIPHGKNLRSVFVSRSQSSEISPIDGVSWKSLYQYCHYGCLLDHDAVDLALEAALEEECS